MSLQNFIRNNRKEIDQTIEEALGEPLQKGMRNDSERKSWIEGDEDIYNWAKSKGVEA